MGLDISVYKVISNKENVGMDDDIFILSEHPELESFKHLACIAENEYFDLERVAKKEGYNLEDLKWQSTSYGSPEDDWKVTYTFKNKKGVKVELSNPPKIKRKELVLCVEEVGYQRKGANKQFYEDGMLDSPCVTKLSVLKEHHEKYFSKNTPDSKGGFGSGLELEYSDKEMKKRFQENIINKFKEGKTFVIYY